MHDVSERELDDALLPDKEIRKKRGVFQKGYVMVNKKLILTFVLAGIAAGTGHMARAASTSSRSARASGNAKPITQAEPASATDPLDDADWRPGPSEDWFVNWDKALAEAKRTKKKLFVLSTGSDWCHWCIKLRENVLEKPQFLDFARKNLVLVYLDSPNRDPLDAAQKVHNKLLKKVLQLSGGVPSTAVFTAQGRRLGQIGGGGQTVSEYVARLREICAKRGETSGQEKTRLLFASGYAAAAAAIAAERAKLPPVTREDFKASVTGIAVAEAMSSEKLKTRQFRPLDTPQTVPFGKRVFFRMEYEIPKGYEARIWVRPKWGWDDSERYDKSMSFCHSACSLLRGKGVLQPFISLLERGKTCDLKAVQISIQTEPELDDDPDGYGWDGGEANVNVRFFAKGEKGVGVGDDEDGKEAKDEGAEEKEADAKADKPKPPVNDRRWKKGPNRFWFVNWEKAVAEAQKTKKKLFVLNTGSDWCGFCIRLRREVLESSKFQRYARQNLVLVYLDDPRKTSLPPDQKSQNDEVRELLGFGGGVPAVKILEPDGETEIETIIGYRGPLDVYLKRLSEAVAGGSK